MQIINYIKNRDDVWKRKIILGIVFFCLVIILILFSEFGLLKKYSINSELSEKIELLEEALRVSDSLEYEINRMKNDSIQIEKIAREKYGMIKKGEEVIILDEKKLENKK